MYTMYKILCDISSDNTCIIVTDIYYQYIVLYNCRLAEPLPPQVSNVKITSLEVLKFEKKELDGKVCLFVYNHDTMYIY